MFAVGDRVKKPAGYQFVGIVRSVFQTGARETRYVVEHEVIEGLLHIFSEAQLMPRASFRPFNPPETIARREAEVMDVSLNDIMQATRLINMLIEMHEAEKRANFAVLEVNKPLSEGRRLLLAITEAQLQDAMALHDRLLALIPEEML